MIIADGMIPLRQHVQEDHQFIFRFFIFSVQHPVAVKRFLYGSGASGNVPQLFPHHHIG